MTQVYTVTMTHEQYNTVLTALRLEYERNYGGDAAPLLHDALQALQSATASK